MSDGSEDLHATLQRSGVRGCDTFVALPPATSPGVVIFGKNSDRPSGEKQSIRTYPRTVHFAQGQPAPQLQCTYISIPQVEETHAVILSQIDWMWGAEMGVNERGVVIGNEAVWTRDKCSSEKSHLLGMDLLRLGLERGGSAEEAMGVITDLLQRYGQGGPCAEDDPSFTYHNSFLIVDREEAWVLETSDRHWVAQRVTEGVRNISNCLSIGSSYDRCSPGIEQYARDKGYIRGSAAEKIDFSRVFGLGGASSSACYDPRFCQGKKLLEKHLDSGSLDKEAMMAILREHTEGICMHGGFETTSSWVSEIFTEPDAGGCVRAQHWATGRPYPCKSEFQSQHFVAK